MNIIVNNDINNKPTGFNLVVKQDAESVCKKDVTIYEATKLIASEFVKTYIGESEKTPVLGIKTIVHKGRAEISNFDDKFNKILQSGGNLTITSTISYACKGKIKSKTSIMRLKIKKCSDAEITEIQEIYLKSNNLLDTILSSIFLKSVIKINGDNIVHGVNLYHLYSVYNIFCLHYVKNN